MFVSCILQPHGKVYIFMLGKVYVTFEIPSAAFFCCFSIDGRLKICNNEVLIWVCKRLKVHFENHRKKKGKKNGNLLIKLVIS